MSKPARLGRGCIPGPVPWRWIRTGVLAALVHGCALAVLFAQTASPAAPAAGGGAQNTAPLLPSGGAGGGTLILYFVLLIVLAGGGLYLMKNGLPLRTALTGSQRKLEIAEMRALGNRQFLLVVEYENQRMLLGVTPGQIDYLCPLEPRETSSKFSVQEPGSPSA